MTKKYMDPKSDSLRSKIRGAIEWSTQILLGGGLFDLAGLRDFRYFVYRKLFDIGKGGIVFSHVSIKRGHRHISEQNGKNVKCGSLHIGDYVKISRNVLIDYCGEVRIGDYTMIAKNSMIFSHAHVFHKNRIFDDSWIIPHKVDIGKYVFIGANCMILPGCASIGDNAVIMPGSVVTKSVPANTVVRGNPAKKVRELMDWEIVDGIYDEGMERW